jgi:hypothetical protein
MIYHVNKCSEFSSCVFVVPENKLKYISKKYLKIK